MDESNNNNITSTSSNRKSYTIDEAVFKQREEIKESYKELVENGNWLNLIYDFFYNWGFRGNKAIPILTFLAALSQANSYKFHLIFNELNFFLKMYLIDRTNSFFKNLKNFPQQRLFMYQNEYPLNNYILDQEEKNNYCPKFIIGGCENDKTYKEYLKVLNEKQIQHKIEENKLLSKNCVLHSKNESFCTLKMRH